uniref:Uncharacterized protein n=7 Tax=Triticinae TaxID=1648030 RepID=A0A453N922_AEGTS
LLSLPRLPIPAARRRPTPRGGRSGAAPASRPASAPSESSSAPFCMGTQTEELAARLAARGPQRHRRTRRRRRTRAWADREEEEDTDLGVVPAVVAALAEPGASPAALVHAAAAAMSFACGVDDGAWAVLAAGAMGHLTRLPAHPHNKSVHWPQPDPQGRGARDRGHPD